MEEKDKNIKATESEFKGGEIITSSKPTNERVSDEKVQIKRGRVDSLNIYEVSDFELTTLERGSTNSIFLNFAIFLISIAVAFLISLLTTDFENNLVIMIIFLILTIVGFLGGGFLLLLWYQKKDEFKLIIEKIKGRMNE